MEPTKIEIGDEVMYCGPLKGAGETQEIVLIENQPNRVVVTTVSQAHAWYGPVSLFYKEFKMHKRKNQ